MPYRIEFTSSAEKEIQQLERTLQRRIIRKVEALSDDPRPIGCRKLVGSDRCYRIRIGDYRIVYEIEEDEILIVVIRVRHRREVYR